MLLKIPLYDGFLRIDEPQVEVALKHNQDPLDGWINRRAVRRSTIQKSRAAPEHTARNEGTFEEITTFHFVHTLSPHGSIQGAEATPTVV